MDDAASRARSLLEDVESYRVRARADGRADALVAGLLSAMVAGGAAAFALSEQLRLPVCADDGGGRACAVSVAAFDGWWYWVVAPALSLLVAAVVRQRRGAWRATASWSLSMAGVVTAAAVVAPLFAGFGVLSVGGDAAYVYPTATAGALAVLALRRGSPADAAAAAAVAAVVLLAAMRADIASAPAWWFRANLGLASSCALVAIAGCWLTLRWRRQDSA